LSTEFRVLSNK